MKLTTVTIVVAAAVLSGGVLSSNQARADDYWNYGRGSYGHAYYGHGSYGHGGPRGPFWPQRAFGYDDCDHDDHVEYRHASGGEAGEPATALAPLDGQKYPGSASPPVSGPLPRD